MRGAAEDLDADGVVAELFAGLPAPPGSVPGLRLLGALHRLVLAGEAPELAAYYPSMGGSQPPDEAWPAAAATLRSHAAAVRARLPRTVQTNEPGRSAVLYGGLLWLTERFGLPVRLLEIGASAGLNLLADRYAYAVGGAVLGDPVSRLRFAEPWVGSPVAAPAGVAARLRIAERAGCDPAPLDLRSAEDRLTLRSYVWPDEVDRLRRIDAALAVAAADPAPVAAAPAERWLPTRLAERRPGTLTVIWQSVVWQYLTPAVQATVTRAAQDAGAASTPDAPVAWLQMEPGTDPVAGFDVSVETWPGGTMGLARAGDHGPPVRWSRNASDPGPRGL
jgi:hypothetical protein